MYLVQLYLPCTVANILDPLNFGYHFMPVKFSLSMQQPIIQLMKRLGRKLERKHLLYKGKQLCKQNQATYRTQETVYILLVTSWCSV